MKLLSHFRSLAVRFFRRSQMDREMQEELSSHIEHRADDLVRSGVDRTGAERQAHIEFGATIVELLCGRCYLQCRLQSARCWLPLRWLRSVD